MRKVKRRSGFVLSELFFLSHYIASSLLNSCIVTSKYKCLLIIVSEIFFIVAMEFLCADTCTPSVPIFFTSNPFFLENPFW